MSSNNIPSEWLTHAERTNYDQTPNYADTIAYARKLAEASPFIEYRTFGVSGQGRDLPLLVASESGALSPATAHHNNKAVVLIQACIHSGEPDGKDAGLALLRDIAITKSRAGLLSNATLLFIPIYNTDGHERSTPYNRINQNGPSEMGWRTTATYQNLNRDYMKADTPETRAWLGLWNEWRPDLFIDCHVTDGADYRSVITYHHEHHAGIDEGVLQWEREIFGGRVVPATEAAGSITSWYLEFIDNRDLTLGTRDFNGSPRFSTGYVPLRNRPAILIETHMLKDYRSRVIGTYDFLRFALEEVSRDPKRLIEVGIEADQKAAAIAKPGSGAARFPLQFDITDEPTPFQLKATKNKTEKSDVSGDLRVIFGKEPIDLEIPMYQTFRVKTAIVPPLYYIVPREWSAVIEVITAHGLQYKALSKEAELQVERYRFTDVRWPAGPFEGRHMPSYNVEVVNESRTFVAGSIVVPVAQPLAKLAISLLEPQAPDSFACWGFFNAIFEHKEYAEPYILESLAREMLEADSGLKKEFQNKLAADELFAASPAARLEFFYSKSPYWDNQMNLYPVGRITQSLALSPEFLQ
jgi:hypothetical protein